MNEFQEPDDSGFFRRIVIGGAALAAIVIILLAFLPRSRSSGTAPGKNAAGTAPSAGPSDSECERRLSEVLEGLSPERLVLSSDRIDRVAELAQWATDCGRVAGAVKVDAAANTKWLHGEMLTRAQADTYSVHDAQHLAVSQLCASVARGVAADEEDVEEQVHRLFRWTIRELLLENDAASTALPRTPLESLMIGRGTAADRAWTFAVLLRQLRLDAVIIEPKGDRAGSWLIGVLKPGGDVWLFDPRAGIPIPTVGADPTLPLKAATLGEVRKDPGLLRRLDLEGRPYPLQNDDLSAINVRLIGDSSTFAARMAQLQSMITSVAVEIFDGLGPSSLRDPGLVDRAIAAGREGLWTEAELSVWTYPEQQLDAFLNQGAEKSPTWTPISEVFAGPTILTSVKEQDDQSRLEVAKVSFPLRKVRMLQLEGDALNALKFYRPIREQALPPKVWPSDPELVQKMKESLEANVRAADPAMFWTAVCQYDQGRYDLALQTLRHYAEDFPLGVQVPAVPDLITATLLAKGDVPTAIGFLESIPVAARSLRLQLELNRLKPPAASAAPSAESPSPAAETPVEVTPAKTEGESPPPAEAAPATEAK